MVAHSARRLRPRVAAPATRVRPHGPIDGGFAGPGETWTVIGSPSG